LSPKTIEIVKATAPVLAEHGPTITTTMYRNMFSKHPELKEIFNHRHQIPEKGDQFGHQPMALAQAVHAYAANIDNLGALSAAVNRIAEKHVATTVQPHHYTIVGEQLLGAIKEILKEAATDEIMAAWSEAYHFLANIFINYEKDIIAKRKAQPGGWEGLKDFKIVKKVHETEDQSIVSFHLKPADGGSTPLWNPGQYIGIRLPTDKHGIITRNYSLSCAPQDQELRITVRYHDTPFGETCPPGAGSTFLHALHEGSTVQITVPCGDFNFKRPEDDRPVVFLGLGVGITAIFPMVVDVLENCSNKVIILQGARSTSTIAFRKQFEELQEKYPERFQYRPYFKSPPADSQISSQIFSWDFIKTQIPLDGHFYFTGPISWMKEVEKGLIKENVSRSDINFEFFGPTLA